MNPVTGQPTASVPQPPSQAGIPIPSVPPPPTSTPPSGGPSFHNPVGGSKKKFFLFLGVVLLVIAIPVSLVLVQTEQDVRQEASQGKNKGGNNNNKNNNNNNNKNPINNIINKNKNGNGGGTGAKNPDNNRNKNSKNGDNKRNNNNGKNNGKGGNNGGGGNNNGKNKNKKNKNKHKNKKNRKHKNKMRQIQTRRGNNFQIACYPQTITSLASGTFDTIEAEVNDLNGRLRPGMTVNWTANPATGVVLTPEGVTDGEGYTTVDVQLADGANAYNGTITGVVSGDADAFCTASINILTGKPRFGLNFLLQGIGNGGDVLSKGGGNFSPKNPTREASVEVYDDDNNLVSEATGNITFNSTQTAGNFTGVFEGDTEIPFGNYSLYMIVPGFLHYLNPDQVQLVPGQLVTLPQITFITGDINRDNAVNMLDYNILIGCFSIAQPPKSCDDQLKADSDLNDDGFVNEIDYNLLLRTFSNLPGAQRPGSNIPTTPPNLVCASTITCIGGLQYPNSCGPSGGAPIGACPTITPTTVTPTTVTPTTVTPTTVTPTTGTPIGGGQQCGQTLTCVNGQEYPTTCGASNGDSPIGPCTPTPTTGGILPPGGI